VKSASHRSLDAAPTLETAATPAGAAVTSAAGTVAADTVAAGTVAAAATASSGTAPVAAYSPTLSGPSAAAGATGASAPPECHMLSDCASCTANSCTWGADESVCGSSCVHVGCKDGDSGCVKKGAVCPAPLPLHVNCQTLKSCGSCLTAKDCVFSVDRADGCISVVQLMHQHVTIIREKSKCPGLKPKCTVTGGGCKECTGKGCEWNDTRKICGQHCYDPDSCFRKQGICPLPSNPLLRKGGPRFLLPGGLGL